MHALSDGEFGLVGAVAPGVPPAGELVVVGVGVPAAPTALFVPVVVDVVDGEAPLVVVDGEVAPEPVGPEPVVVVVVVLTTPRRCASGPHVEAVASVRSNDTFCALMVDERCGAGDATATAVTARGTTRRKATGWRALGRPRPWRARTRARPRQRASGSCECRRPGTWISLRGSRHLYPVRRIANPLSARKTCGNCGFLAIKCPFGRQEREEPASVR